MHTTEHTLPIHKLELHVLTKQARALKMNTYLHRTDSDPFLISALLMA